MSSGAYGYRLGEYVGIEAPPTVRSGIMQTSEFAVTRLHWDLPAEPNSTLIEQEDAFLLFLQRRDIPANPYWMDGRAVEMAPLRRGQFLLLDLHSEHASIMQAAVDCIALYLPKAAFRKRADELGGSPIDALNIKPGDAVHDSVVWHLGEAVLPALEKPDEAHPLMIEHVGLALLSHLTNAYGERSVAPAARGGLSPAQLCRVKDRMAANLSDKVSLNDLAQTCGLSRGYFAHAFKTSTGVTPFQWLMRRRIERAKELLLRSSKPIEEIAEECGFADQSHLTRKFAHAIGTTPGRWRRGWRN
jgi:AraC family transcriptional regulator